MWIIGLLLCEKWKRGRESMWIIRLLVINQHQRGRREYGQVSHSHKPHWRNIKVELWQDQRCFSMQCSPALCLGPCDTSWSDEATHFHELCIFPQCPLQTAWLSGCDSTWTYQSQWWWGQRGWELCPWLIEKWKFIGFSTNISFTSRHKHNCATRRCSSPVRENLGRINCGAAFHQVTCRTVRPHFHI